METYQVLPTLSPDEYATLKASIAEKGVQVPIEYDEAGNVLDGHHRLQVCQELGIKDWPRIIRVGFTEEQKLAHVLALNLARRHLTQEQRDAAIITARKAGMSIRDIAKVTGIPQTTVYRTTAGVPSGTPAVTIGHDGKKYQAQKPKPITSVMVKNRAEAQQVQVALARMDTDALPDKVMDVKRVVRLAREQEAERRADDCAGDVLAGDIQLWMGDFRERGAEIADASVDLIFTDPPYPQEFLPLWSDLSAFAARVLKPDGMLIAYTGAMYLPEVIARMGEGLRYWWCGAIVLDGQHSRVHGRNISQGMKQLLFYVRRDYRGEAWVEDTFQSESVQKDAHDWQQSIGCARYYIEKLCPKGGLVVDPFLGGGTTGLATREVGSRRFVGIEIDKVAFASAQERLSHE